MNVEYLDPLGIGFRVSGFGLSDPGLRVSGPGV